MSIAPPARAKKLTIYKNGDTQFPGKKFVVNKVRTRTWDSFLQDVTIGVKANMPVRVLRTPVGGTMIKDLDDLQDDTNYVAVSNGRFKKIGYLNIEQDLIPKPRVSPRYTDIQPVAHSRIQVSGRIRKIPTDVIIIYVYANARPLEPARRVTLTHQMCRNWSTILDAINDKVQLTSGAARRVYSMDYQLVTDPATLQTSSFYIAVGADVGGLKKLEYGQNRPNFYTSPRRDRRRLEPIHYPRPRGRSKNSQASSSNPSSNQSPFNTSGASTTGSSGAASKMASPRSDKPPRPSRPQRRPKQEEDVFHAKPVKHKRTDNGRTADYDKDEGGVFKAKKPNKATAGASEVEETRDTHVDLPIDQVEAEEVKDEEIEGDVQMTTDKSLTKYPSSPDPAANKNNSNPAKARASGNPPRSSDSDGIQVASDKSLTAKPVEGDKANDPMSKRWAHDFPMGSFSALQMASLGPTNGPRFGPQ